MSQIFFFTDPSTLNNQNPIDAYGPKDDNKFQLNSIHSGSNSKAIAVVGGSIFAQYDPSGRINLLLIPNNNELDEFSESTIDYIIYRGIAKNSLIDTSSSSEPNKIQPPITNDLTKTIWKMFNSYTDNSGTYPSDKMLGLQIDSSIVPDSKPLFELITNNPLIRPININAGDVLGDFDTNFSLEVCLKRFDTDHTTGQLRNASNILDVSLITQEDERRKAKERCLQYLDISCLYGEYTKQKKESRLKVRLSNGNIDSSNETKALIYSNIITKFHNHDCVYIDLRNTYDYSYNYQLKFKESSISNSNFKCKLGTSKNSPAFYDTTSEYGRREINSVMTNWPIQILRSSEIIGSTGLSKSKLYLKISVINSNNKGGKFYLFNRSKYIFRNLFSKQKKYICNEFEPIGLVSTSVWSDEFVVNLNYQNSSGFISSYIRIMYCIPELDADRTGTSILSKEGMLDNFFPILPKSVFTGVTGSYLLMTGYNNFISFNDGVHNFEGIFRFGLAEDKNSGTERFAIIASAMKLSGNRASFVALNKIGISTKFNSEIFDNNRDYSSAIVCGQKVKVSNDPDKYRDIINLHVKTNNPDQTYSFRESDRNYMVIYFAKEEYEDILIQSNTEFDANFHIPYIQLPNSIFVQNVDVNNPAFTYKEADFRIKGYFNFLAKYDTTVTYTQTQNAFGSNYVPNLITADCLCLNTQASAERDNDLFSVNILNDYFFQLPDAMVTHGSPPVPVSDPTDINDSVFILKEAIKLGNSMLPSLYSPLIESIIFDNKVISIGLFRKAGPGSNTADTPLHQATYEGNSNNYIDPYKYAYRRKNSLIEEGGNAHTLYEYKMLDGIPKNELGISIAKLINWEGEDINAVRIKAKMPYMISPFKWFKKHETYLNGLSVSAKEAYINNASDLFLDIFSYAKVGFGLLRNYPQYFKDEITEYKKFLKGNTNTYSESVFRDSDTTIHDFYKLVFEKIGSRYRYPSEITDSFEPEFTIALSENIFLLNNRHKHFETQYKNLKNLFNSVNPDLGDLYLKLVELTQKQHWNSQDKTAFAKVLNGTKFSKSLPQEFEPFKFYGNNIESPSSGFNTSNYPKSSVSNYADYLSKIIKSILHSSFVLKCNSHVGSLIYELNNQQRFDDNGNTTDTNEEIRKLSHIAVIIGPVFENLTKYKLSNGVNPNFPATTDQEKNHIKLTKLASTVTHELGHAYASMLFSDKSLGAIAAISVHAQVENAKFPDINYKFPEGHDRGNITGNIACLFEMQFNERLFADNILKKNLENIKRDNDIYILSIYDQLYADTLKENHYYAGDDGLPNLDNPISNPIDAITPYRKYIASRFDAYNNANNTSYKPDDRDYYQTVEELGYGFNNVNPIQ